MKVPVQQIWCNLAYFTFVRVVFFHSDTANQTQLFHKRQLICFGIGAAIGIPTYLLTRVAIGNTGALFVMLGVMLPAFLKAMYEKDGLPFEKMLWNMIYTRFLRP